MDETEKLRGSMEGFRKQLLKIAIVGASRSGKSALTVRFLTGKFIYEYATGKDFTYQHTFLQPPSQVPLEIIDTSQTENWSREVYDADGAIVVYAIDNQKSFEKAEQLISNIISGSGKIPCTALVANKSDLWQYKSVESSDGKNLANKYSCSFFEMSALSDGDGVREMFGSIIKLVLERTKVTRSLSLPTCKLSNKIPEPKTRAISVYNPNLSKKDKKRLAKKASEKNAKLLGKTLGGMGLLSLTTLALPTMPAFPED